jgi:hypothetical protein
MDPDEHVEHIDTVLDYHEARGAVKCKLLVLTLKGSAMTYMVQRPQRWLNWLMERIVQSFFLPLHSEEMPT